MIRITNSSDFERIITNMELHLKNVETIFQNETNNMERINATEIWTGDTQEVIYNKYQELKENYNPIIESLGTYIKFMRQTIEDYKKLENKIGNDIDINRVQLDVNS